MRDNTRKVTNKLIEMMDEGLISARAVADAALIYFSEDDIANMAHDNELLLRQDIDDDDNDTDDDEEDDHPQGGDLLDDECYWVRPS